MVGIVLACRTCSNVGGMIRGEVKSCRLLWKNNKFSRISNKTFMQSIVCGLKTYSQIDGPFGWKPCRAFAVFARAKSVITVRFVGLLMFLVHSSGLFRPNVPAEMPINKNEQ